MYLCNNYTNSNATYKCLKGKDKCIIILSSILTNLLTGQMIGHDSTIVGVGSHLIFKFAKLESGTS